MSDLNFEIKIVRLNDAKTPDVIAEVASCETGYVLRNAHIIAFGQNSQGANVKLVPFIPPYADDSDKTVSIPGWLVSIFFKPMPELAKKFGEEISGLILPGGNTIAVPSVGIGISQ